MLVTRRVSSIAPRHIALLATLLHSLATVAHSQQLQACSSSELQCSNSTKCVPAYYKCDGANDCLDNSDERQCTEADLSPFRDNFVLALDGLHPGLYQIEVEGGKVKQLMSTKPLIPQALTYDAATNDVYWTDTKARTINKFKITTRASVIVYADTSGTASYDGLALDAGRQLLYYTNGAQVSETVKFGIIGEISTNGSNHRIIRQEVQSAPRGIVVDVANRSVYWTDWGDLPGIYRAPIDTGTPKVSIVTTLIMWPNALAIDFTTQVMYWADAKFHKIEMANLDGSNRRVIVQEATARYYGMTLSPEYLYVSDWQVSFLKRVNRKTFEVRNYTGQTFSRLSGLAFYSSRPADQWTQNLTTVYPLWTGTSYGLTRNTTDSWLVDRLMRAKIGVIVVVAVTVATLALVVVAILIYRRRRCRSYGTQVLV